MLSSAIQQVLAADPRLQVEVLPSGETTGAHDPSIPPHSRRTVEVRLLEDPVPLGDPELLDDPSRRDPWRLEDPSRIEVRSDGHAWVLEYRGLDGLAHLLTECHHRDTAHAVRSFLRQS